MEGGEKMNKRIVLGAFSILASLGMMASAAFAAFTASATNTGNTFGSGSLALNLIPKGGTVSTPVFNITSGAAPGATFTQDIELSNTGNIDASSVQLTGITLGGPNTDLAGKLTLLLFNDANDDGIQQGGEATLGTAHLNDPVWSAFTLTGVALPHNGTVHIGAVLTFDQTADNTFQGKTVNFNLGFQANQ